MLIPTNNPLWKEKRYNVFPKIPKKLRVSQNSVFLPKH
jgi:hypothetical protein